MPLPGLNPDPHWLRPDWPAGPAVGAVMTTRHGGCSRAPYDTMNLGSHVGDVAADVLRNRERLQAAIGARPVFLDQVHGSTVVQLDGPADAVVPPADASFTTQRGVACVVGVADCLPVLFAAPGGSGVAAAHAGWRGLAAGVLERTAEALARAAGCEVAELVAWLGPCLGPRAFEVGADVRDAFGAASHHAFELRPRPDGSARWLADLPRLARDRLHAAGLRSVSGGDWCTYSEGSRFFSFRRDGVCGRMVAAVWLR
jgi:YfiH family protein